MVAKPGGDGWDLNINYDGLASLPKLSVNGAVDNVNHFSHWNWRNR